MTQPFCQTEVVGRILIVTMNRPEKLNALIPDSHHEMAEIFRAFESEETQDVAILTGAGRAFCVGSDISAYVAGTNRPLPPEGGGGLTYYTDRRKPVIAAVNGLCMGGGFEIALSCDLMIADRSAAFALPEVKVGAAALGGGMVQLARKLPPSLAMSLVLTGDRLTAEDAWARGLISEIVEPGRVREAAIALAMRISGNAPMAVRASRDVVLMTLRGMPSEAIWKAEETIRTEVMQSDDFTEGMTAFVEKRAPRWRGR